MYTLVDFFSLSPFFPFFVPRDISWDVIHWLSVWFDTVHHNHKSLIRQAREKDELISLSVHQRLWLFTINTWWTHSKTLLGQKASKSHSGFSFISMRERWLAWLCCRTPTCHPSPNVYIQHSFHSSLLIVICHSLKVHVPESNASTEPI